MLLVGEKVVIRATRPVLRLIQKLRLLDKKMVTRHLQNKTMARRQQRRGMCGYHRFLSPSWMASSHHLSHLSTEQWCHLMWVMVTSKVFKKQRSVICLCGFLMPLSPPFISHLVVVLEGAADCSRLLRGCGCLLLLLLHWVWTCQEFIYTRNHSTLVTSCHTLCNIKQTVLRVLLYFQCDSFDLSMLNTIFLNEWLLFLNLS